MAKPASRSAQVQAASRYETGFRVVRPSADRIEAGRVRQGSLNIIVGTGCGTCTVNRCGTAISAVSAQDGGRIRCPMLDSTAVFLPPHEPLTPEERTIAKKCGMPALYAAVHDKKRTEPVAEEEVADLRPDFSPPEPEPAPAPEQPADDKGE